MNLTELLAGPTLIVRAAGPLAVILLGLAGFGPDEARGQADPSADITEVDPEAAAQREAELLGDARQLTFEGRRAGEGYFHRDGSLLVFQSEREPGNPFFQIYLMDLEFGDVERISPGIGKTTCAWVHPDSRRVLFASTQDDPDALAEQEEELQLRAKGEERRYSWDYDEFYDLYVYDRDSESYTNLTQTRGYDAEGAYSPDGSKIVFASNRRAYSEPMTDDQRAKFAFDPAYMMDIYIMDADGSNVRQLTSAPGYDGGPFFSPNGRRICWRRFSEDGATAEIYTMETDGTDQRRLTDLGVMSWAPFYHPSNEYLIFTTNRHGFANFELYLVDVQGRGEPIRVTYTKGFDGLPVFSPKGDRLVWTSNRTGSGNSQLFTAAWDHEAALERIEQARDQAVIAAISSEENLDDPADVVLAKIDGVTVEADVEIVSLDGARVAALENVEASDPNFSIDDLQRHVEYLCREELAGRLTGTPGERLATAYVAGVFEQLGLEPAGTNGSYFQEFPFTAGLELGTRNRLAWGDRTYEVDRDYRPVAFSATGEFAPAPIVFAGYGINAPAADGQDEYDSYVHLDVADKWVLVFRYMPERIDPARRQHLARHSSLRYKTMVARDRGARGLIVVSGPNTEVNDELIPLGFDGSLSGSSLPVLSVTNEVAEAWLKASDPDTALATLQDALDDGEPAMGLTLEAVQLEARIDITQVERTGRNVLARLPAEDSDGSAVLIGAHVDHLGQGTNSSSLARDDERDAIHFGADDNASGVAAVLEIAQYLADLKANGRFPQSRDVLFAAWSGEELGLLGSTYYVDQIDEQINKAHGSHGDSSQKARDPHANLAPASTSIRGTIAACLNLDMVGRLDDALILQGVGSSSIWRGEVERRNVPIGLPITLSEDSYIPTDASVFYLRGVPILSAFTGSHSDYHTPRDTPDLLNYDGMLKTSRLMGLILRSLALGDEAPDYVVQERQETGRRANLRAYLGTIPDYASDIAGVKISGASKGGPADQAGLQGGDVIVELAGRKIENIYDYTYAIEALKVGQTIQITVLRDGERLTLEITPGSRD